VREPARRGGDAQMLVSAPLNQVAEISPLSMSKLCVVKLSLSQRLCQWKRSANSPQKPCAAAGAGGKGRRAAARSWGQGGVSMRR
jgi:hypothetical protein